MKNLVIKIISLLTAFTILEMAVNTPVDVYARPSFTQDLNNITVEEGETAVFTVESPDAVSYKWVYTTDNWDTKQVIAEETSNTLTIPNVTMAMNGYQYDCEAKDSGGETRTSMIGQLTVTPKSSTREYTQADEGVAKTIPVTANVECSYQIELPAVVTMAPRSWADRQYEAEYGMVEYHAAMDNGDHPAYGKITANISPDKALYFRPVDKQNPDGWDSSDYFFKKDGYLSFTVADKNTVTK